MNSVEIGGAAGVLAWLLLGFHYLGANASYSVVYGGAIVAVVLGATCGAIIERR